MKKKLPLLPVLALLTFFFLIFSNKNFAQQWGYATLIAPANSNQVTLLDTNSLVVKQWSNLSGNTGYSSYLTEGGFLWRTVANSGNQLNGGGVHGRIQKVAWNGTLLFNYLISDANQVAHHDICPMPNGNVLVIVYVRKTAAEVSAAGGTANAVRWSEKVIELKPTGLTTAEIVWEWHLWDHLVQDVAPAKANYQTSILDHPELLNINYLNNRTDWVHMNGIDYNAALDQIVLSSHWLNEMWVIDHSTTTAQAASHAGGNSGRGGDFLYRWGNPAAYGATGQAVFKVMHDAHWVPADCPRAGWLGAFNNQGVAANQSAFDLFQTTWNGTTYTHTPGQAYPPATYGYRHAASGYSSNMGSSQQLPNGNHLVCLATAGRVYEINDAGQQLWTYTTTGAIPQAKRYSRCFIENPKLALVAPAAICPGSSVQLDVNPTATAVNTFTYNWSPAAALSDPTAKNPTATGLTATTNFQVTVTTANGCTATATVPATVHPTPTADAGPDVSIIAGQSAVLTATGGINYQWSTGQLTPTITVSPQENAMFTVTVTDANGCTATDKVTVNVTAPISVSATAATAAFCLGGSTQLAATASGGAGNLTFSWSSDPAGFFSNEQNPIVNPTVSTIYTLAVSDGASTSTATAAVTVHPLPTANAGSDLSIISGQMANLTATGGLNFAWNTGATTAEIQVSPTENSSFAVTVTDANGCTATDEVQVFVKPKVSVVAAADRTAFCIGGSAQLAATAADGTGNFSFSWSSEPAGFSSNLPNPTVFPTENTKFTVEVSDGVNTATASVQIEIFQKPAADAGADQQILIGTTAILTATGGATFEWSTGATTAEIQVSPVLTTTYFVTATSTEGCTATDATTVTVTGSPLSAIASANATSICFGKNVELSAVASGGTGNYIFQWSENGVPLPVPQNFSASPAQSTLYEVKISDGVSNFTTSVLVNVEPAPLADAGADQQILIGTLATLTATGGTSFEWSTGETTASISVKPATTTTYFVTVTGANGCTASDAATVEVTGTLLTASITASDAAVCSGKTAQLFAQPTGGSGNYEFEWFAFGVSISDEQNPTVSPLENTTYFVEIFDGITLFTDSISLKINPLPTANAGDDQTILKGNSAELTATGGTNFEWSTGATTAKIIVAPTETTPFSVTVTDDNGCSASDEVTVEVLDFLPLTGSIAATATEICLGDALQLVATAVHGTGNYSFEWSSEPAGFSSTLPDPFVNPEQTTTYKVKISDGATSLFLEKKIVVNPQPQQPTITVAGQTLVSSAATNNQWFFYGNPIAGATGQVFTPTLDGAYQVQIVDANGCASPLSEPVEFFVALPLAGMIKASETVICLGEVTQLFAETTGGVGSPSFEWSSEPAGFSSTLPDPFVNPEQTTTYKVKISDGVSTIFLEIKIVVNPQPQQPVITVVGQTLVSSSATNNQWFFYGNPIAGAGGQVFTPTLDGSYQVQITDANGCASPLSEPIEFFLISTKNLLSDENWSVAPNPTAGQLAILGDFADADFLVEIFDAAGRRVLQVENLRSFSVAGLAGGVYFLKLTVGGGIGLRRVVVLD